MTKILGISAYYHDSAAALIIDGKIVAAAQEERFTRIKHDAGYPCHAIEYCLKEGNIQKDDLDYVVFYEKPLLKFERLLESYLAYAPRGFASFLKAMPVWLKKKMHTRREIKKNLKLKGFNKIIFPTHHETHAASAFFASPFDDAAILTIDGVGEWDTCTLGHGKNNKLSIIQSIEFPNSLGLLYSAFTYYTGFKVNSGEYKLMGLAPYGKAVYADIIKEHLLDIKEDGSFALNMDYFSYGHGLTMTNHKFHTLFGGEPRTSESEITQREMDLAASIQSVTEDIVLNLAKETKRITGSKNLCMAGGVALNCVANGKLLRSQLFDNIWIQPASGDAGGALGGALFAYYHLLERTRSPDGVTDMMQGGYLGPSFSNQEIQAFLHKKGIPHHHLQTEKDLYDNVADIIDQGKVIGWFQGRMEFGPRALGARSIIGDARNTEMQSKMNLSIKFRESFRPFAPSVIKSRVADYFEMEEASPYMLLVANVKKNLIRTLDSQEHESMQSDDLTKRINIARSSIPAITHIDLSARIQTVDERNDRYHKLIKAFEKKRVKGSS